MTGKNNQRIRQSVCRWCFAKTPIELLAQQAVELGLVGIDLVDIADWCVLKKHGLSCTLAWSHSIDKGLNNPAHHAECLAKLRTAIEATSAAGFSNVVCFSGNRTPEISDELGMQHCETALKEIIPFAEEKGVTLCLELLNSKLNHPGYMCDHTAWAAALANRIGSPRFKLIYDIYHMQVQEGDVIATIQKYKDVIGHYHTAGVPGRKEIDSDQELNYPAIMRAIADTGFTGIVAHEFIPKRDPLQSLREAVEICNV